MKTFNALILSIVSLWGLTGFGASTPEKVAVEFIEAMIEGDIDDVYDVVYLNEKDKARERAVRAVLTLMSEKVREKADKLGDLKSVEVDEVRYNEAKTAGVVTVTLIFDEGEKKDSIRVLNRDNEWKVKVN